MKRFLLSLSCLLVIHSYSQVAISTTNSPANASAMLDVQSTTRGMLLPRLTLAQRNAIATPAMGLMVYQTDNKPGFYYYTGTAWSSIGANTTLSNLKAPTSVNANLLPDTTALRNLGSASLSWKNVYYNGSIFSGGSRILGNNGSSNTFAGIKAGNATLAGAFNTAVGADVLPSITTGYANTALGSNALDSNTAGHNNTATGFFSLYQNTIGNDNTANGVYALTSNIGGNENTATGFSALGANTYGMRNTASGAHALENNFNGLWNTATGYTAMQNNVQGNYNTAYGYGALKNNNDGDFNVSIGYRSLDSNQSGNYNTAIGVDAGFFGANLDNTTTVGFGAAYGFASFNNYVVLGNSSVTNIGGQVGFSSFSDGRVKDNVRCDVPGLAFINKLRPVTYNFNIHRQNAMTMKGKDEATWQGKYDIEKKRMTGFIAQEVEQAASASGYDFSGVVKPKSPEGLYALTYSDFVVPITKAIQELSKSNDEKDAKNIVLQKQVDDLQKQVNELKALIVARH